MNKFTCKNITRLCLCEYAINLSPQKPLPKLPVPNLQHTLEKYTELIQPILSTSQYAKTKDIVQDFGKPGAEGEYLQTKLKECSEAKDNWVSHPI